MAKLLKELVRHTVLRNYDNLVALDDPYLVIRRLLAGRVVSGILDAGASTGRVSRKLLKLFPAATAYGFEANPAYAPVLRAAAAAEPRLKPHLLALADAGGRLTFNVTASPGSSSLLAPGSHYRDLHPQEAKIRETIQVEAVTIDDWRAQNGAPGLEVMKFDIQGGEILALRGGTRTLAESTLLVYTEVFFNPMYDGGAVFGDIDQFLRQHGFQLYNLYKPCADRHGMLDQGNAIFVKPALLAGC